jgi:hypothetical protein
VLCHCIKKGAKKHSSIHPKSALADWRRRNTNYAITKLNRQKHRNEKQGSRTAAANSGEKGLNKEKDPSLKSSQKPRTAHTQCQGKESNVRSRKEMRI